MLVGLGRYHDMDIFLTHTEVENLANSEIKGTLVLYAKPKQQFKVTIVLDRENAQLGINAIRNESNWELYVSPDFYGRLKKNGKTGTRYGLGWQIALTDLSRAEMGDRSAAQNLQFYIENRERLPKEFE